MPRRAPDSRVPSWDKLYESAAAQAGYFSLEQARAAGYSSQLLQYYVRIGRIERSLRGVFRLVHFPPSSHEDLVPVWLWSKREAVFGLETALAVHGLSDVLPAHYDIFVPHTWAGRRVQKPRNVRIHVGGVARAHWEWIESVPVTTVARTVRDCVKHHVQHDLVRQALAEAVGRGLLSRAEARAITREAA